MADGHWLLRPTWWGGRKRRDNDDVDRCGGASSPAGGAGGSDRSDRVLDMKYITSLFEDASDEALNAASRAIHDIQRRRWARTG
jgi:hypothetical protein